MEGLKKELNELFEYGYEEVYFRDDDKDDGIMDRFKDKTNDNIICFILCEFEPYEETNDFIMTLVETKVHLHYHYCYGGSDEFKTIKTKYKLNHDWEDPCIVCLYKDEELYEDTDEED